MNLIQIGVNTANDDFFQIVKGFDKSIINKILLVEPIKELNLTIEQCYNGYNYILENIIINNDPNKKTEQFFVSKYSWISSLKEEHVRKYGGNEVKEMIELPAITLNELFQKHDIEDIEILFIDTEGMDDKLIMSVDFSKYNIQKIYYEHVHIDNDILKEFLKNNGYETINSNLSDNLTSLAIKKT